jgi:hypothetical protein
MNNTAIISFRSNRNLESWIKYASYGFNSKAELLSLILTRMAYEQSLSSGLSQLLGRIIQDSRQTTSGNTKVYSVRLPMSTVNIIKTCAVAKHQNVSEWASCNVETWSQNFQQYKKEQEQKGRDDDDWLEQYGQFFRDKVNQLATVYARKHHEGAVKGSGGTG